MDTLSHSVNDRDSASLLHRGMALLTLVTASLAFVAMLIWPLVANHR